MAPPKKEVKVEKNLRTCIVPFCPTRAVTGLWRLPKGQYISEQDYEVIVSPKIRTKYFKNICPSL